MPNRSVASKGQVTIPKSIRQQLGLRRGSRVEFVGVGDHAEMRVVSFPAVPHTSGFGMLESKRPAVPADYDAAAPIPVGKTKRNK